MALEFGSIGFSYPIPELVAADWYTSLHMPDFFDLDIFTLEDAPLSQETSEPSLPPLIPPSSTSELPPDLPFVVPLQLVEAVNQSTLPFPQATSEAQKIQSPRKPHVSGVGNSYNGMSGAGLWTTSDEHSFAVVPTIPQAAALLPSAATSPTDRIRVPQRSYDHGRKQWNFKPSEPISFSTSGCPGINLRDALRKKFTDLDGRDDPMLQGASGAISCRLLFPGYPDNGHSCQIHTLSWTRNRQPITRSKLAYEIARKVERYLDRMARITPDEFVEDRWKIGRGFMHIDNMFLVSLASVSKGSFQPEIWVAAPSASHARAGRR